MWDGRLQMGRVRCLCNPIHLKVQLLLLEPFLT